MSETPPPSPSQSSPSSQVASQAATSSQESTPDGSPSGTLVVIGVLMVAILGMWGLVFTLMVLRS